MKRVPNVVILLSIFGAGLVCLFFFANLDIPAPDTRDLTLERSMISADRNGYTYFLLATNSLYWPTNDTLVTDYLDGKAVDDAVVQEVISRNTEALGLIDKGLRCDACITPEVTGPDTVMPYLGPWRSMGRFLALKTRHERLAGEYAKAAGTCITLLHLGDIFQKDAGCLIHYLVGIAVLDLGLTQAQDLARDQATPRDDLARLSEALAALRPFDRGLIRAIKAEHTMVATIIDRFRQGKYGMSELAVGEGMPDTGLNRHRIPRYFFQPNRTQLAFASLYRDMITNATRPYAGMSRHDAEAELGLNVNKARLITRPNAVGKMLYGIMVPAMDSALERRCRAECCVAATRLIVGLNAYQKQEGKLPDNLQSLVPAYLPSVPVDPYDGKPFRYSASREIVYSVGKDLKDSGGSSKLRERESEDTPPKMRWKTEDVVFDVHEMIAPETCSPVK